MVPETLHSGNCRRGTLPSGNMLMRCCQHAALGDARCHLDLIV